MTSQRTELDVMAEEEHFERDAMNARSAFRVLTSAVALAACLGSASAQQVTGVPGSPSATTTLDGKQLPPPDPKFGGIIKEKASESTAWWTPRVTPPKGAPNVLLIMTDDVGFSAPGTLAAWCRPLP